MVTQVIRAWVREALRGYCEGGTSAKKSLCRRGFYYFERVRGYFSNSIEIENTILRVGVLAPGAGQGEPRSGFHSLIFSKYLEPLRLKGFFCAGDDQNSPARTRAKKTNPVREFPPNLAAIRD